MESKVDVNQAMKTLVEGLFDAIKDQEKNTSATIEKQKSEIAELKSENEQLKSENEQLKSENERLNSVLEELQSMFASQPEQK